MKRISVIIPAFNEEKNIAIAIEALFAQDYKNFEVIVIDNASTDRTSEVAKSFPVKVVEESRKGTMWACECGRKESEGEIIVRMDADCIPDRDWLSKGVRHFDNENVVAVTGPYNYFDAKKMFRFTSLYMQILSYSIANIIVQFLHLGGVMIGGNSFMRKNALEKAGGFNTDVIFYGDDTDTAKRLSHHGKIVFDRSLIMKTSFRRFKKEGIVYLTFKYWFYFLKHILRRD